MQEVPGNEEPSQGPQNPVTGGNAGPLGSDNSWIILAALVLIVIAGFLFYTMPKGPVQAAHGQQHHGPKFAAKATKK